MLNRIIKLLLLIISSLIINSCNSSANNPKKLSIKQKKIIQNCINSIMNGELKSINGSYLINPYFEKFSFNNYMAKNYSREHVSYKNKIRVLQKMNFSNSNFETLQEEVNSKYEGKYFSDLIFFSKGDKSHLVLTFSGISDKLVFLEIIKYCEIVSKNELSKKIDKDRLKKDVTSLAIIIDENEVKDISVDGGTVIEIACDTTALDSAN